MNMLTQNSKMKKSSTKNKAVYNWTIPAFKGLDGTMTCPNASKCVSGCYAQMGAYIWSNVRKAHQAKLDLTKTEDFVPEMIRAVTDKLKKSKKVYIRIHDAGDFYSLDYTYKWFNIIQYFKGKSVVFYAYTKQVEMFKKLEVPENLKLIYSFGGKQDSLINTKVDRHSWVFESKEELQSKGYVYASKDDMLALTDNINVGLVYHGNKSYKNTTWSKVK